MANEITRIPIVESEVANLSNLRPAQRDKLLATIRSEMNKLSVDRLNEARKRGLERTKLAREKLRRGVPGAVTSIIGGAIAEVARRKAIGAVTDNLWGQALGLVVLGGAADALDSNVGLPLGDIGKGPYGVAGFVAAVAAYDNKDKRDPVAVALQGTTEKYKKDMKKKQAGSDNGQ